MQEGRLTDLLQQLGPTQMQSTHSALADDCFVKIKVCCAGPRLGDVDMRWLWDLISLCPTVVYLSVLALPRSFLCL